MCFPAGVTTVPDRVGNVLFARSPNQVGEVVVLGIAVEMSGFTTDWRLSYKCSQNASVDKNSATASAGQNKVPSVIVLLPSEDPMSVAAPDSPSVADFVTGPVWYWPPCLGAVHGCTAI